MIVLLDEPSSYGAVVIGVSCFVVSSPSLFLLHGDIILLTCFPILLWGIVLLLLHWIRTRFFCYDGFFAATLPPVDLFDDPASISLPLSMSLVMTGIFHSSIQSLIAQYTSSALTQYRSCNHSSSGYLHAWIHMFCLVALNLAIPWYCATTSIFILYLLAILSFMSLRYLEKVLAFPLLCFGSEVLPKDLYHDARHYPTLSYKYEYVGSFHLSSLSTTNSGISSPSPAHLFSHLGKDSTNKGPNLAWCHLRTALLLLQLLLAPPPCNISEGFCIPSTLFPS
jgi:hypothetical protein